LVLAGEITKDNKKFDLIELENFIIKKSGGQSNYYDNGGYEAFYNEMQNILKLSNMENSLFIGIRE
jgi:hypothetical protein